MAGALLNHNCIRCSTELPLLYSLQEKDITARDLILRMLAAVQSFSMIPMDQALIWWEILKEVGINIVCF